MDTIRHAVHSEDAVNESHCMAFGNTDRRKSIDPLIRHV
jgi:hypothetical protein